MKTTHATGKSYVEELLDDARLVYEYAMRTGKLPDDALPKAIEAVEETLAKGERPNTIALAAAMAHVIKEIAPVTLIDLRERNSPFDAKYQRAVKGRQYRLVALTVFLASLIAYYSIALHQGDSVLRELQEVQNSRILDKIAALRKLVQHEEAFNARDSRYDQYRQLMGEIRDLEARRHATYLRVAEVATAPDWPFEYTVATAYGKLFQPAAEPSQKDSPGSNPGAGASTPATTQTAYADICANSFAANVVAPVKSRAAPSPSGWIDGMTSENLNEYCFLKTLDLGNGAANYVSPFEAVSKVRDKMLLQSAWILPFLSGLLGAAVFMLRDALDASTPLRGTTPATVRIVMGGIAGIIIGWFWAAPTNGAVAISSVPFGLAFLTGFSIDILFTALDRVKASLSDTSTRSSDAAAGHKPDTQKSSADG